MSTPKVSVIVPIYNTQAYLDACISSVLRQSMQDFEIICIDDGSTDNSISILKHFAKSDSRLIILTQTNQGPSVARNVGLGKARGQYIYFLDSDDYIEADTLELACKELDDKDLDIVYFDTYAFGESGIPLKDVDNKNSYYSRNHEYPAVYSGEDLLYKLLKNNDYSCPVWKQVVRKSFLQEHQIHFYQDIIHEDELYTLQSMMMAGRVAYIHRKLHHRRLRPDSIMTKPVNFYSVYGYFICAKEAYSFLLRNGCNQEHIDCLVKLLGWFVSEARKQYEKVEERSRQQFDLLKTDEKFLFQVCIADYTKVLKQLKEAKQKKNNINKKLNEVLKQISDLQNKSFKLKEPQKERRLGKTKDKRFETALANVQFMMDNFSDSCELTSGWLHDFVCPRCTSQMAFTVNAKQISPEMKFYCPNCKTEASGQKYFEAWVYRYRRYFAENLGSVIVCALAGEEKSLQFLKSYINFYAENYNSFPIHGQHAGKGKIMAQSLDEAVWGIYVLKAVHHCRRFLEPREVENWYKNLFGPMAELLIPQVTAYNNIAVWIQSCIGMIGLVFDKKELVDTALNSEFGLYKQLEKGLTDDYLWYEGSLHYHYYMLEGLTYFCELYADYEPQSKLLLMLDKMYQAPAVLMYNDVHLLSLNDGWYPLSLKDYAKQIIQAAAVCKSKVLFDQVAEIEEKYPEVFDDPATLLYERKIDADAYFLFNRHVAVLQKPFPLVLKSGSCTASHMHRDALSIVIPPFSVDLGTPGYGSAINDSWYRAALSHNTVCIDGEQPKKLIRTEVHKTKDGVEAFAKDWPDVLQARRRLYRKGKTVSEVTTLQTAAEHIFDWIFHSEGNAEYSLDSVPVDSLGKGYDLFSDIRKVVFDKEFVGTFKNSSGSSLKVKIPFVPDMELYTARTPSNPADHKRNTLLLRVKGTEAKFEVIYSMSETVDKMEETIKKNATLDRQVKKLERELNNIQNGWSFRIGRVLTYLPRKMKKWFV